MSLIITIAPVRFCSILKKKKEKIKLKLSTCAIRHLRNETGNGAEICPARVSGIVIGDAPVCYWSVFPLSQVTAPEVFEKVNSAQFPSRSLSAELVITIHSINLLLSCHTRRIYES